MGRRTTLAGTGGETLARTWWATLARESSAGDLAHDKKSLADDSGGDGGRPWQGRRGTWRATLPRTDCRAKKVMAETPHDAHSQKELGRTLRKRRTTLKDRRISADDYGGDGGPECLARGQERGRPGQLRRQMARSDMTADDSDGGWRTTLAMDAVDSGEDVAAIVTHHADVTSAFPNIATSVRLVQHGEGEEAEHKTHSSPASGGCGWVPRYEDGATHDHFSL